MFQGTRFALGNRNSKGLKARFHSITVTVSQFYTNEFNKIRSLLQTLTDTGYLKQLQGKSVNKSETFALHQASKALIFLFPPPSELP